SFDAMRASVISSWVASRDPDLRDAAAVALNSAAQEQPALAPAIRNLILAWAMEDERPPVRAGAARAWRALLDDDGSASRLLDSLATTDNADTIEAICLSMAEYLAIDDERSNREAIGLLHSWANARDPDRRLVGELAFLYAAGDLVERRTGGTAQEGTVLEGTVLEDMVQEDMVQEEEVWPALLATAARDPL